MLKKLSMRHLDIIRRLLVAQTPGEICLELGVCGSYLSILQADPIFQARLELEQAKLSERFIEQRMDAMQILEDAAAPAAKICVEAMAKGTIGERILKPEKQLESAWDILDRTGNRKADKHVVGFVNLADLVAEAYKDKHKGNGGNGGGDHSHDGAEPVAAQDSHSDAVIGEEIRALPPLLLPPPQQLCLFKDF